MDEQSKQMVQPTSSGRLARSSADPVPAGTIRDQLTRMVNSPGLISSARLCRFLTHIVNRTIDGDIDSLKEFSIAMEVFDRTSKYDPSIDAIVRVEARRLRSKLKAYYEEGPGTADPVLIGLRPGSYVPVFRWLDSPPPKHREEIAAVASARTCVVVLPLVNMSPEPEQDYFCDGITEEITNSLTRLSGLNVIARTSAFHFKAVNIDVREVGERLGADVVIEGSVRKAGDQLRITVQAIQAASGHHLWSETFRRELKDVFVVQEEIAKSVAEILCLRMPNAHEPSRPSAPDLEAYTSYLRARFLTHQQSPETLHAATHLLRKLVEVSPSYALAYSGLAESSGLLATFGVVAGRDVYPEVKACAERGYALDPDRGEACAALAGLRAWFEYRWDEAEILYDRSLALQPGQSRNHMFRAMTLLCRGNIEAAEMGLSRSMELDPLSAGDCARMAYLKYIKGDFEAAADYLRQSSDLDRNYPEGHFYEGLLHFRQRHYDAVIQCLSSSLSPLNIGLVAAAHVQAGNRMEYEGCIQRLHQLASSQYVTPLAEGCAAIGAGDLNLAFRCLDEAINHKTHFMNLLAVEPFFAPLHADQRFAKLLRKLKLLPQSRP